MKRSIIGAINFVGSPLETPLVEKEEQEKT
jgi:hypothetical protein